jgi:hypothetical protein
MDWSVCVQKILQHGLLFDRMIPEAGGLCQCFVIMRLVVDDRGDEALFHLLMAFVPNRFRLFDLTPFDYPWGVSTSIFLVELRSRKSDQIKEIHHCSLLVTCSLLLDFSQRHLEWLSDHVPICGEMTYNTTEAKF